MESGGRKQGSALLTNGEKEGGGRCRRVARLEGDVDSGLWWNKTDHHTNRAQTAL